MKVFMKRIIWFFGFWTFDLLDELVYYATTGEHFVFPNTLAGSMTLLMFMGMWFVPLMFMKDDEE